MKWLCACKRERESRRTRTWIRSSNFNTFTLNKKCISTTCFFRSLFFFIFSTTFSFACCFTFWLFDTFLAKREEEEKREKREDKGKKKEENKRSWQIYIYVRFDSILNDRSKKENKTKNWINFLFYSPGIWPNCVIIAASHCFLSSDSMYVLWVIS